MFPAFLSVGRIAGCDPPRFVGFIQDLTLRKHALTAVQRESDRAAQYLEAAQTMLVALDLSLRVTLINRKGCEVLGCNEGTLLGADWFEMVVPSDATRQSSASKCTRLPNVRHTDPTTANIR